MNLSNTITIPAAEIPVTHETDICVIGGSCTGVFAAVRAARLGANVAIVEKQNCFGGVATAGLVNIWHSIYDEPGEKQIIAGLTLEVIERLKHRDAVHLSDDVVNAHHLNTEELKIDLDELVKEHRIEPFLHSVYSEAVVVDGAVRYIIIQTPSGRTAIEARQFIDVTGDGVVAKSLGCKTFDPGSFQPPTTCAKIYGMHSLGDWSWVDAVRTHGEEFGQEPDWGWSTFIPGLPGLEMRADAHIFGLDTGRPEMHTHAEIEGRRKVRAIMDVIRKYAPSHSRIGLADLAATIGVRESYRLQGLYTVSGEDILYGKDFGDAIAYGSYRVDTHHDDGPGITFRYLDGTEVVVPERGAEGIARRWRPEVARNPTYYQIPLRSLVQAKVSNLMLAGRMIDADKEAFSAIRVMINMNQTGEAAGVASYLALSEGIPVQDVQAVKVRELLEKGGSIMFGPSEA